MPEPTGDNFPNVDSLKNPAQKILTQEYSHLTTLNRSTWLEFQPKNIRTASDIEIHSQFPEYEEKERRFTFIQRQTMLKALGLMPKTLDGKGDIPVQKDSDVAFQYTFSSGDVYQLRYVHRTEDDVNIPVFSIYSKTKDGYDPEKIVLLSEDTAQETKERYEANQQIDKMLFDRVGVDSDMLQEIEIEEKQAMLDAWEKIHAIEAVEPEREIRQDVETAEDIDIDLTYLSKIRMKLVKAMLPGSGFLKNRRDRQYPHLKAAYYQELHNVIETSNVDYQTIYHNERLMRLAGLSKQLHLRTKSAKIGQVAIPTVGIAIKAAVAAPGVAIIGSMEHWDLKKSLIGGGILGGILGLVIHYDHKRGYKERVTNVHAFSEDDQDLAHPTVDQQLQAEIALANKNIDSLNG